MPFFMLSVASVALLAGSAACAGRLERRSMSTRLLLLAIIAAAQVTALVLVLGGPLRAFRPIPLLLAAVVVGTVEVVALHGWRRWSGPMAVGPAVRRALHGLRHHPGTAAIVAVATAFTAWQSARAARIPTTSWDSLHYHLPEPSTWVLSGRITRSGLTLVGAGYPQGQEVLHGWTMVFLHSIRGTGLVPLGLAAIAALSIFRIAKNLGATTASATVGAAVFLAMPAAALQIGTAYVDLGAAAFALAALALGLDAWRRESPLGLLFGAVLAAGLAVATKPSMAPVVLAVAVLAGAISVERRRAGARWRDLAGGWIVGIAVFIAIGGCWYIVNYVQHRNPLYPVSAFGFHGHGSFDELVRNTQAPGTIAGRAVPVQLWHSWTADLARQRYTYDQRLGGLGAAWVLVCLPALAYGATRLWRKDRLALGVLGTVAVSTWALSGSMWWSRFTLVLAGIGCAALALALDALRAPGEAARAEGPRWTRLAVRPAVLGITLVLVALTAAAAISPTDMSALDPDGPPVAMTAGQAAKVILRGDAERTVRPWASSAGVRELPTGSTIGFVDADSIAFTQVLIGVDLDHRVVRLGRSRSPEALREGMRRHGARYIYLPKALDPEALEMVAVGDRLHFRRVQTDGPIEGGGLWELGTFDECAGGQIDATVRLSASGTVVAGQAVDGCGAVGGADLELWLAGSDVASGWTGATQLASTVSTEADGSFIVELPGRRSGAARYFLRFVGRQDGEHFRPPLASNPVSGRS